MRSRHDFDESSGENDISGLSTEQKVRDALEKAGIKLESEGFIAPAEEHGHDEL
jgi:hypothetical protein